MSDNNTEVVSTNEYGIADADYAAERKAARAKARNPDAPDLEVTPIKEPQPSAETAETVVVVDTTKAEAETPAKVVEDKTPVVEVVEDPLAGLPDEWKEKVASQLKAAKDESDYQKKRYESDIGRINAYQSKYEEARRALAQKEAEVAALKKTPPKSLKESDSPKIKEALEAGDEHTVEMLDELAASLRKEMEAELAAHRKQLNERDQIDAESRQRQAVDEFNRTLTEHVSNWHEVVYQVDDAGRLVLDEKTKQPIFNEGWATYILDQPPALQNAIVNVGNAQDAIWAIDNYSDWLKRKGHVKDEAPAVETKIPNADAIQAKRDADLKRKAPPAGHQVALTPSPQVDMDDPATEARLRKLAREALRKNDPSIYSKNNL